MKDALRVALREAAYTGAMAQVAPAVTRGAAVAPGSEGGRSAVRLVTADDLRAAVRRSSDHAADSGEDLHFPPHLAEQSAIRGRLTAAELARRTGAQQHEVRRYAQLGLLPAPMRTRSWGNLYPPEALSQLAVVRAARGLGMSVPEIRKVCAAMGPKASADERTAVASRLRIRMVACEAQLALLGEVQESLDGAGRQAGSEGD